MKVALQIDEPWDHASALTAKWWIGTLDREDWVALDEPVPFRGREGRRVKVGPRYEGDSLATLHDGGHHRELSTRDPCGRVCFGWVAQEGRLVGQFYTVPPMSALGAFQTPAVSFVAFLRRLFFRIVIETFTAGRSSENRGFLVAEEGLEPPTRGL